MPKVDHGGPTLPIRCPKCDHEYATLFVNSYTVLTVFCVKCSHAWSVEISALPKPVQRQLPPV
jgi:transcription elongation factor Elf1